MPQDQTGPNAHEENSKKENAGVDLSKILLPKKDPVPGKTLDSAQRVNAGALLAQEQTATLPKQPAPQPAPTEKKSEESIVSPIETYQGDIEKLVQQKNVSVVSIAAAEAARRAAQPVVPPPTKPSTPSRLAEIGFRFSMVLAGIIFLALTAGVIFILYQRTLPVQVLQNTPSSPFISVDGTKSIVFESGILTRAALMSNLELEKESLSISLGLMTRLLVAQTPTMSAQEGVPIDVQRFVSTLAPGVPQELVRALTPEYLLGLHSYDGNQAFLILSAESYQQAFSGMLKWEPRMQNDLAPLFTNPKRPSAPVEVATTTATSTPPQSPTPRFLDAVVENFDARVIRDDNGDTFLLWTFLDPHTIIITTNEYTLREVLSRRTLSPGSGE